ncbi:MAG: SDR family NAD(P)-dependent oxidoreductase [Candidatus Bathyarchaeia archaeon]
MKIRGKTALVTGAAKGIGREISIALAQEGLDVAVADLIDTDGTVSAVKAEGRRSIGLQADVTKSSDSRAAVDRVVQEFGTLDLLVNNAGILRLGELPEVKDEDWNAVFNVNLFGTFAFSRAALSIMKRQKSGRIICIASVTSDILAFPKATPYATTKAGVIGFVKSLAKESAPYGINVNGIAPGIIESDQSRYSLGANGLRESVRNIPLGRIGQPIDVAKVVVFLASDLADYITGETTVVDGGLSLGNVG